jgi:hypothetical protein
LGRISQDIDPTIISSYFEVTTDRIKPAVEYLCYFNASLTKIEAHRGLLTPISGITLYPYHYSEQLVIKGANIQ